MSHIVLKTIHDLKNYLEKTPYKITVIKLTAKWCQPCKSIEPAYQQWAGYIRQNNMSIDVLHIDVDECMELYSFLKSKRAISGGIPTFMQYNKSSEFSYIPNNILIGANVADLNAFFNQCLRQL